MNRVLIVYASKHGQTEKISYFLKEKIEESGAFCEIHDIERFKPSAKRYETVILGGPVYGGKFLEELVTWTKQNRDVLNEKSTALFTVTMNAADKRGKARKDEIRLINEFLNQTGIQPKFTASFAGALKFLEYNWLTRMLMKHISKTAGGPTDTSRNYEFTDWKKVEGFASDIIENNHASEFLFNRVLNQRNETFVNQSI